MMNNSSIDQRSLADETSAGSDLKLSNYFTLARRYSKSINLERDLDDLSALNGYILTDKAIDSLGRIVRGLTEENQNNC